MTNDRRNSETLGDADRRDEGWRPEPVVTDDLQGSPLRGDRQQDLVIHRHEDGRPHEAHGPGCF